MFVRLELIEKLLRHPFFDQLRVRPDRITSSQSMPYLSLLISSSISLSFSLCLSKSISFCLSLSRIPYFSRYPVYFCGAITLPYSCSSVVILVSSSGDISGAKASLAADQPRVKGVRVRVSSSSSAPLPFRSSLWCPPSFCFVSFHSHLTLSLSVFRTQC